MTDEAALLDVVRQAFSGAIAPGAHDFLDDVGQLPPPRAGCARVVTADQMIEGRHFEPGEPADAVGHRAILRNLSDLAAAGAQPVGMVWTLAFDVARHADFLAGFCQGAAALCRDAGLPLFGGDLSTAPQFSASITAWGDATRMPGRRGARPGDVLCVSDTIGQGAAGRRAFNAGEDNALVARYLRPPSPVAHGLIVAEKATACLDVSDGLSLDLARLCQASGVGAVLDALDAAVAPGATTQDALSGGDDYVLLFTWPAADPSPAFARTLGHITDGPGMWVQGADGGRLPLSPAGHDPFSRQADKP